MNAMPDLVIDGPLPDSKHRRDQAAQAANPLKSVSAQSIASV